MLVTPFGTIVISMDGVPVAYTATPIRSNRYFPDVNGAYMLRYDFENDGREHTLSCFLKDAPVKGGVESGERLEAVSLYIGHGKLTIGCEGDFLLSGQSGYDFDGYYCHGGICLTFTPHSKRRTIWFGVAWLEDCTEENDTQTWYAVDTHRVHPQP